MSRFKQTVAVLANLEEDMGGKHPVSSGSIRQLVGNLSDISMESAADIIKLKSSMNVELFDENIRKLVNGFYEFSAVYRDNHVERFIKDAQHLEMILSKEEREFTDKIRWSDDENYVEQLRKPVSFAYLNLFQENNGLKVVVEEDFWKCTDLHQLHADLHKTNHIKNMSTLFVTEHAFDKVTKLLGLILELRLGCVKLSESYEVVIGQTIDTLVRGESIPLTDAIDFEKTEATILGNVIKAEISNAINRKWYQNNIVCAIGSMVQDTRLLLADPLALCTPNSADEKGGVDNLFKFVKSKEAAENLIVLQRELVNIVDQVDLSSRRLTKLIERLRDIPQTGSDSTYNYALQDISVLISVYSGALSELIVFATTVAQLIERSFEEMNALVGKVNTLKHEIDKYIAQRLKA